MKSGVYTVKIIIFVNTVNLKARGMLASSKRATYGWLEVGNLFFLEIFKLSKFLGFLNHIKYKN